MPAGKMPTSYGQDCSLLASMKSQVPFLELDLLFVCASYGNDATDSGSRFTLKVMGVRKTGNCRKPGFVQRMTVTRAGGEIG